jgi:rubrerythrin
MSELYQEMERLYNEEVWGEYKRNRDKYAYAPHQFHDIWIDYIIEWGYLRKARENLKDKNLYTFIVCPTCSASTLIKGTIQPHKQAKCPHCKRRYTPNPKMTRLLT